MEEDINYLKYGIKELEGSYELHNREWAKSILQEMKNSLEHLIKAYKELEENNSLLIQQNITYKRNIHDLKNKSIPVSLVEEKIEDFRDKTVWGYNDWKYDENVYKAELNIIDKLEEELLEKRK